MRKAQNLGRRQASAAHHPGLIMGPGRVRVVLLGLGLLFLTLLGRALYLQLVQQDFLQNQGDARFRRSLVLEANRGVITDRNGEPLAISTPVQSIWASPDDMAPVPPGKLRELARLLEMPASEIAGKLADKKREFVFLKRQISPEIANQVIALGIPGVARQQEYRRYYPAGEVMAHVVGFTGVDGRGQEGLELAFDEWLSGTPGAKRVIRDGAGRIIENVDLLKPAQPGHDLTLTIDRRIQYLAFRE
ncbi:MAG: penicillin-binding protein 2, partial [Solimonas sp.]